MGADFPLVEGSQVRGTVLSWHGPSVQSTVYRYTSSDVPIACGGPLRNWLPTDILDAPLTDNQSMTVT